MSRINTNVSSLIAQKTLTRNNQSLQTALTRLSTGLRINTGKDDPAGLIASEVLRSDITSVNKAIMNTERASQMIATADSALNQVSNLLNDIRGLVVEAANTGAMSEEQIAANQLQVDSSLEAIDRIAQTTTYQGRKLLDGTLDFQTTGGTGFGTVTDLSVDQANLGTAGSLAVDVSITTAATVAQCNADPLATGSFTIEGQTFTVTAANGQIIDNVNVAIVQGGATGAAFAANTLTITLNNADAAITAGAIQTAIDGVAEFAGTTVTGAGTIDGTNAANVNANAGQLDRIQDLVLRVAGREGSEVFNFQTGTTIDQMVAAINLVTDATGVTATNNAGQLRLNSVKYGTKSDVSLEVITEGTLGNFETNLSAARATGQDIVARVNGVQATGDGNTFKINTATLDLSMTVTDGSTTAVSFTIDGGGAIFQLGPDVVSNQQARMGIKNINTGSLGTQSGRLYELRSGSTNNLSDNVRGAAQLIDEVVTKVAELRGRLGAFQRTTLDSNTVSLSDYLTNLTEAESSIRDADFAKESAALTRAQVLVQSGTQVLAIANQSPQNVLALLQ
ncbi:MAG: flagellin [Planctomycetota bacterium]|nr:flagellin [Planctomycetota bacterium]